MASFCSRRLPSKTFPTVNLKHSHIDYLIKVPKVSLLSFYKTFFFVCVYNKEQLELLIQLFLVLVGPSNNTNTEHLTISLIIEAFMKETKTISILRREHVFRTKANGTFFAMGACPQERINKNAFFGHLKAYM